MIAANRFYRLLLLFGILLFYCFCFVAISAWRMSEEIASHNSYFRMWNQLGFVDSSVDSIMIISRKTWNSYPLVDFAKWSGRNTQIDPFRNSDNQYVPSQWMFIDIDRNRPIRNIILIPSQYTIYWHHLWRSIDSWIRFYLYKNSPKDLSPTHRINQRRKMWFKCHRKLKPQHLETHRHRYKHVKNRIASCCPRFYALHHSASS